MEPLTIKTPADVLSFVGHTLGFWPHESLVCITLDANRVGATLRVDLPNREGGLGYARTVADYLAHDAGAASVLFAVCTSEPQKPGSPNRTQQRSHRQTTSPCRPRQKKAAQGRRRQPRESNSRDERRRCPRASQDTLGRHAGREQIVTTS
jgi:hypothetical protein